MPQANFPVREGQNVPEVSFRIRRDGEWATVTTDEIFGNRNVVVFSLPGAYTPTCSSTHLPRYNELWPAFKAQGIDAIVCLSVNDPFVMDEWGRDQEAANVFLLARRQRRVHREDGPARRQVRPQLRQALVALLDARAQRRGSRSSSSSRTKPGDPFEVSDADTMLAYINPEAKKPDQVAILTRDGCSFCAKAKRALTEARVRLRRDAAAAHDPLARHRRHRRCAARCRRSSSTAA